MASSVPASGEQRLNSQPILDMNYAFARTAMVIAAVRLHLFTHLANKALTPKALATLVNAAPDPLARLLKGLELLGLVSREEDMYRLTPLADHFLVEGKPTYLGGDSLAMVDYLPAWFELDHTVQTTVAYRDLGSVATAEAFFAPRVLDLFPVVYPIAARTASELPLTEPKQILDVGAGSAPWSAAFAQRYPAAQVTALDLPDVVEQGQKQIAEIGLSDRYTWIASDMDVWEFPSAAYDLVIVAHVCRFISDERTKALFKKVKQCLCPGGTLIVADVFFTDDRMGPPPAITLDLSMMVNTAQGRIRTSGEIVAWLGELGFHGSRRFHVAGPFPAIIAQKEEKA